MQAVIFDHRALFDHSYIAQQQLTISAALSISLSNTGNAPFCLGQRSQIKPLRHVQVPKTCIGIGPCIYFSSSR